MGSNQSSEGEQESDLPSWIELPIGDGPKQKEAPLPLPTAAKKSDNIEIKSSPEPEIREMAGRDKVRIRIPSPMREQGDGMEIPEAAVLSRTSETSVHLVPQTRITGISDDHFTSEAVDKEKGSRQPSPSKTKTGVITLPNTGIKLEKLPPIQDFVEIAPVVPRTALVAERPPTQVKIGSLKKNKEPKFVPYEPYKGAVTKIVNVPRKSEERKSGKSRSSSSNDIPERKSAVGDTTNEGTAAEEVISENQAELIQNYRVMLDAKEAEITELRNNMKKVEQQLKIQAQVNGEVKKLLVASVGEDIEARVDFLTQDKARLAADLVNYSTRIDKDWEEKDALSVESDVWRSKFLASSVIVDEMTRSRQNLAQRAEELEHSSRRLLHERHQLRSSLYSTQAVLDKLNTAFDPLSSPAEADREAQDVLQVAGGVLRSCQRLAERLVGEAAVGRPVSPNNIGVAVDTAGERELKEVLAKTLEANGAVPDLASTALTGKARPLLVKLGDQVTSDVGRSRDFKTCGHCQGSVQVV